MILINEDKKPNRNGGIFKKPGRKVRKAEALTPKQDKFVQIYLDTGNASLAKKQAGYSDNTAVTELRDNPKVSHAIEKKQTELWDMFKEDAVEAYEVLKEIMRSDKASYKVRLDASNSLLDRAGYKAVDRKEVTGTITGGIASTLTLDLIQRTRELMANKAKTIDITHEILE